MGAKQFNGAHALARRHCATAGVDQVKATRVDGVYSEDPERNPHAVLYESLTYDAVIEKNLRVMDATAIALCREHNVPILVFNFKHDGNIVQAVTGKSIGTWIGSRRP